MAHQTRRFIRSFRENLQLGTLLAFVAGIVNTVGFLQFDTYVSHISGHATRAAVEYAEGNTSASYVFFLEVAAFIAGAAVTAFLLHGHTVNDRRIKFTVPIALEAFYIFAFLLMNRFDGWLWLQIDHINLTTLILAHAMGMQNALLRHTSGTIVRTTHMTGVATDIGVEIGAAFYAGRKSLERQRALPRFSMLAVWHDFFNSLRRSRVAFHGLLLFFFFFGAAIGTMAYFYVKIGILYLPFLILSYLTIHEFLRKVPHAAIDPIGSPKSSA